MQRYVICKLQKGLILLPALMLMQILILLSGHIVTSLLVQSKLNIQEWQYDQLFRWSLIVLRQAEESALQHQVRCTQPITLLSNLAQRDLTWWQTGACKVPFAKAEFYYVIEDLGQDECAEIDAVHIAHYMRVTLLAWQPVGKEKIVLQTTLIKADNAANQCVGYSHAVKAGRQSWYLYQ